MTKKIIIKIAILMLSSSVICAGELENLKGTSELNAINIVPLGETTRLQDTLFPFIPVPQPVPVPHPVSKPYDISSCRTEAKDKIIREMLEGDHEISARAKDAIMDTLSIYSEGTLDILKNKGFKLKIIANTGDNFYERLKSASAYYMPGAKFLAMRKDYLEQEFWTILRQAIKNLGSAVLGEIPWGDNRSTLIHEMGHAIDDMLIVDGALGSSSQDIRNLYEDYKKAGRRWSFYAKSKDDMAEYVAEGHRMFSQSVKSNMELEKSDLKFYRWIAFRTLNLYDNAYRQYILSR